MADVNIGAELTSLPLGQMLSGPLTAAIDAQALSATHTADFITTVGMDDSGAIVTLPFKFKNAITNPSTGEVTLRDVELNVPLLSLIEPPHISIADLSVSFEFKIRDVISKSNQFKLTTGASVSTDTTASASAKIRSPLSKFLGGSGGDISTTHSVKTNFNVSATYQQAARHETDRSATLKMTMTAQQRPPEGFQRVMEILNNAITAQATLP